MFIPLAKFIPDIARHAIKKRSRVVGTLLSEWKDIVGPEFSVHVYPFKIASVRGRITLRLHVFEASLLLIKYQLPLIQERIDSVIGQGTVDALTLHPIEGHPALSEKPDERPKAALSPEQLQTLDYMTAAIEDQSLKRLLIDYGRLLLLRNST